MSHVTKATTIDAPIADVWPVLADFANTYRWNPEVPRSFAVNDLTSGLGARRRCEFNGDGTKWLEERIVEFDEANHTYTLQIVDGTEKPPIDDVHVTISAIEASPTTTLVTMSAGLVGRGPIKKAVAVLGGLVLKRVLDRLMRGLAHHVATGEEVRDARQLRSARAMKRLGRVAGARDVGTPPDGHRRPVSPVGATRPDRDRAHTGHGPRP